MIRTPRQSFEALPSWLARLPEIPPTPIRPSRPPDLTMLQRALANPRLPLHIVVLSVGLGIAAAVAARSVRATHTAELRAEMSSFATRKAEELRAFETLRSNRRQSARSPLVIGGSLTEDAPGYTDVVEGTAGRQFRRRWTVTTSASGERRVVVRVIPTTREAGRDSLDIATVVPHR
jgi:hypothetical protein